MWAWWLFHSHISVFHLCRTFPKLLMCFWLWGIKERKIWQQSGSMKSLRCALGNYLDADLLLRCSRPSLEEMTLQYKFLSVCVDTEITPDPEKQIHPYPRTAPFNDSVLGVSFLWGMGFLFNVSHLLNARVSKPSRAAVHCRIDQCWAVILPSHNEDNSPIRVMMSHTISSINWPLSAYLLKILSQFQDQAPVTEIFKVAVIVSSLPRQ